MNNRFLIIGIIAVAVSGLVGGRCFTRQKDKSTVTPIVTPAVSVYENDNLKIYIPEGWTATEAKQPVYEGVSTTPTYLPNPAAVNITNGKWILYINTNASQASSTPGGRFAEIGMGAPSVDAVVIEQPSECGQTKKTSAYDNFTRVDYFVSAADKKDWCVVPTNDQTVWFFSYLTSPGNGFFNYYTPDTSPGLVITMAYNTKMVDSLPVEGDIELSAMLKQMTDIVATLEIKKKQN